MFANIFQTFANCFRVQELRSRIFFTALVLCVCRILSIIPIPGLDGVALNQYFERNAADGGGILGMYSMFTGGALEHCAIGSLGIMPYISATIIIQLLGAVIPQLSKLLREEGGRAKIVQYGRYLTVLLCFGWGIFTTLGWEHPDKTFPGFQGTLIQPYLGIWWYRIQTVLILTTGTMLLMWLGEQITERGIGNGVSLVISIGILARLPAAFQGLRDMFAARAATERFNPFYALALIAILLGVIAGVIAVLQAQRKIPVQYAQRAVGRKVFQGGSSFMPLKVNYAGVMPVIFAQAILMFPAQILQSAGGFLNLPTLQAWSALFQQGTAVYMLLEGVMILFFSYFWVATQFNELQIADDLKKNGGYIPGVRPGQATSDYLHNAMQRITLAGAIFLTLIAVVPSLLSDRMGVPRAVSQFFGGTSMLILVGVVLDTTRQIESHLQMRHYDGFLKKGKIRGRI